MNRWSSYFILAAASAALYAATLQNSVQAADSGELQLVAATFGVAHPPGYPLWSMIAGVFARMPGIMPLTGISLFSLITAVATLLVVAHTIEMILSHDVRVSIGATFAGVAAAASLGVASTFWAQATGANIRSLTALFAALLAWAAARSYVGRPALPILALVLGLGVAHHPSLVFPGVIVTLYVLLRELRDEGRAQFIRRMAAFVAIGAAVQIVWLYLPLRDVAGAAFAPGSLRTWQGFLDHALARGFGGDMFWFVLVEPQRLVDRLQLLPSLTAFVFGDVLAAVIGVGILLALVRRTEVAVVLFVAAVFHMFVTLTYRAPQTVEYALPAWVLATVLLGVGVGAIPQRLRHTPTLLLLGAVVVAGASRWTSFREIARDSSVRDAAANVLAAAPDDAVVLAQWHQATPLWAVQYFESTRRDVRVEYVAPNGAQPYAETFAARARELSSGPVLATSWFEPEFARAGLYAAPIRDAAGWQMSASPVQKLAGANAVRFDDRIDVQLESDARQSGRPGSLVPIDVAWQVDGAVQQGDSLTVRIFRRDGRLAATGDLPLMSAGRSGVARRVLALPLDLDPGAYELMVGAYRAVDGGFVQFSDASGREFVAVGSIDVGVAAQPPATRRVRPDVCLWNCVEPALVGVDYDLGLPGRVRLWTHFRNGATAADVAVVDASGNRIAPSRTLDAASGYRTLAFDIPPARSLQLRVGGRTISLPDFLDGERYVPFGDRMALIGVSTQRRGGERLVDLEWLSARPIVDDYVVSVRLAGDAHDGVPALGALPTLKWLRGSRIIDRHPFKLSVDAPALDAVNGNVVVYDSLTRVELPVLDERYEGAFKFTLP